VADQPRATRNRDAASASGGVDVERPRNLTVTRTETPAAIQPDIAAGYAALQSGDLDRAMQAYDRAVRADPTNRDALLGAGTVQLRLNRPDVAERLFRQTLRHHPQDSFAAAQLAALTGAADPIGTLSQVNSLIARESGRQEGNPDNGTLQFMQGNQLSLQGRWPEAQQAYFNAHRADPNNADYCFNLAVSLDRIRELRLARDYYNKALELARTRSAGFDQARAQTRLQQINESLR
jgi:tetratricopeptide (TPR) repeat protein